MLIDVQLVNGLTELSQRKILPLFPDKLIVPLDDPKQIVADPETEPPFEALVMFIVNAVDVSVPQVPL